MKITWKPVCVGVGNRDEDGRMVMLNGKLVAILVHLTGPYETPELRDKWFVEAGFGPLLGRHELFSTWEEAEAWVHQHYEAERKRGLRRPLHS